MAYLRAASLNGWPWLNRFVLLKNLFFEERVASLEISTYYVFFISHWSVTSDAKRWHFLVKPSVSTFKEENIRVGKMGVWVAAPVVLAEELVERGASVL